MRKKKGSYSTFKYEYIWREDVLTSKSSVGNSLKKSYFIFITHKKEFLFLLFKTI